MSDGILFHGQQFNPDDPVVKPYTKQMMDKVEADALIGQANTEITPVQESSSEVMVYDLTAIQALLDATVVTYPSFVSLDGKLPNELVSVAVTSNNTIGTGSDSHPITQQDAVVEGSFNITISPRASASASAAVLLDVQPVIKQTFAPIVPAKQYYFFLAENQSMAQLLTKLTALAGATVNAFPAFRPVSHVLTLKGQSVSVSVKADTTVNLAENSASTTNPSSSITLEWGNGFNEEVGISNKTVVIPPTIHPLITLSPFSDTAVATATADASTIEILGTGIDAGEIDNVIGPRTKTATASITPASLAATSITAIPTSGLYLVDLNIQPYQFDRVKVFAEVVDFAYFA